MSTFPQRSSRYITGLSLSPNKTVQGIYDLQVWDAESPSRRAMHAAVFEAQWDAEALMPRHRAVVARDHGWRGREVMSLDWTLAHHEWGPKIYGVTKSYDYVERRMARFQTVVTAVVANRALVDGIEVRVQEPSVREVEEAYVQATTRESYEEMEHVRARLLELLHHLQHRFAYKKRTEIVVEIVKQLEQEGHFPTAHYAFDSGVALTRSPQSYGITHHKASGRCRSIAATVRRRRFGPLRRPYGYVLMDAS